MTYNNPQHSTTKYSCTPFPILKEGDTSNGIVTYLDLVDLGSITGFGVNLTEIGGTHRWDNTTINSWQTLFEAINEHLTIFNARLKELEQHANPDAIIITPKSNNQLEANADNVSWSSSSAQIIVNPAIGKTTTYSLSSSATSYGSFTLTASASSIQEGSNITITAQWTGKTTTYDATITATKSGMTSTTTQVQLSKDAIRPSSVTLDNGKTITLNANGTGSVTYAPTVGSYTVKTQGNETQGSCSFTVTAKSQPQPTTTYYWYVGAGPVNASTTPGNGTGWNLISGTPTRIETGDNATNNNTKINWVLAVPTALNLTHLSNGDDITDLYDITIVTCADGVQYRVFTQIRASKRIDVTFVA